MKEVTMFSHTDTHTLGLCSQHLFSSVKILQILPHQFELIYIREF